MVFHWSLSGSQSPQVSRTRLNILANLDNAVVWIVSILPLISHSSYPFTKPLGTVPRVPITIGTTVIFMFHNFFSSLTRSKYLFLISFSLVFTLSFAKFLIRLVIFYLLFIFYLSIYQSFLNHHLISWSVFISKSQRILCLILLNGFWFVHIPFSSMVKFQAHLPYSVMSFSANLLHSFIMWLFSL